MRVPGSGGLSVSLTLAVYQWLVRPFAAPGLAVILLAAIGLALPARGAAATPAGLWFAAGASCGIHYAATTFR